MQLLVRVAPGADDAEGPSMKEVARIDTRSVLIEAVALSPSVRMRLLHPFIFSHVSRLMSQSPSLCSSFVLPLPPDTAG
jgi:hypothetical protein